MRYDIVASIVLYKNQVEMVERALLSVLRSNLQVRIFLIDNSPMDDLKVLKELDNERIEYVFNSRNLGYGAAHNVALKNSLTISDFHLVLNPDVYFESHVLDDALKKMRAYQNIGLLSVKTLYPDGSIQRLCKLLPTPFDLIARRFLPQSLKDLFFKKWLDAYELRHFSYDKELNVPNLSGSFMLLRNKALEEVGFFDEKIFMYTEDIDLTRRIHAKYQTIFFPSVEIFHDFEKGSYKSKKLMFYHMKSAIYYFNKWGWFFDKERRKINRSLH